MKIDAGDLNDVVISARDRQLIRAVASANGMWYSEETTAKIAIRNQLYMMRDQVEMFDKCGAVVSHLKCGIIGFSWGDDDGPITVKESLLRTGVVWAQIAAEEGDKLDKIIGRFSINMPSYIAALRALCAKYVDSDSTEEGDKEFRVAVASMSGTAEEVISTGMAYRFILENSNLNEHDREVIDDLCEQVKFLSEYCSDIGNDKARELYNAVLSQVDDETESPEALSFFVAYILQLLNVGDTTMEMAERLFDAVKDYTSKLEDTMTKDAIEEFVEDYTTSIKMINFNEEETENETIKVLKKLVSSRRKKK